MNIFLVMTSLNLLKMWNQKFHNVEYYDGKWKQKKMPVCFHFPSQVQYDEASDYTFYNEIVCWN